VIQAATAWKSSGTKITGMDLINVESLLSGEIDSAVMKNITWVRGNL
jgi:hypothetical protein